MIRQLPRPVIERIAAGEVIERPASVVKELVENALDAGARSISVAVEDGGLAQIRVADDGCGIAPEDLPLALASHATSKLHDVDDLYHIASFGFRGEALASIAAVSRCRIVSRTGAHDGGLRIESVAGDASPPEPAACAPGTTVEVRDLFFNTPARRHFLGASRTEAARCREVCATLSLVHPDVRWRFDSDGQTRFTSDGDPALRQRVAAVHGHEFVSDLVDVEATGDGLAIGGLLSLPSAARSRPRAQRLFVNGRPVRDRAVMAAVRSGCQDFLPGSLHPSWVLFLSVDPTRVDVNVHPAKAEVRFRDGDAVFRLIRSACRHALLGVDLAPRVRAEHLTRAREAAAEVRDAHRSATASASSPGAKLADSPLLTPSAHSRTSQAPDGPPATSLVSSGASLPGLGALRAAGSFLQVLDTYIVHDSPRGLVLIDQHALHERILYARLQAQVASGQVESQRLLLPETLRPGPTRLEQALQRRDELSALGLQIEAFGPDALAVHAVPAVLRRESAADLVEALLDPADVHGGIPNGLDRRLFTMACHAAVKAGDALDHSEIADLLRQGEEIEHDSTCPHGRPTRLLVDAVELERLFKRSGF
ncbi:MAG: DNA mismatch repair endonuclease MutL [Planctomycetota bacterium]|jgi:DNA mismatch repair protein MutL